MKKIYYLIVFQFLAQLSFSQSAVLDASFNVGTGANTRVKDIKVQSDGKIIIAGDFNSYNGNVASCIARINPDGTFDPTFSVTISGFDGGSSASWINSISIYNDGKILIGGNFTSVNGFPRPHIARLNQDGSIDQSFNPGTGTNSRVSKVLLLPSEMILICGGFSLYNGIYKRCIVRLFPGGNIDNTFDSTYFDSGTSTVPTLEEMVTDSAGRIIVGGNIIRVSIASNDQFNLFPRKGIARLNIDGSLDPFFFPDLGTDLTNNVVKSIALQNDSKIIIGGNFTQSNGINVNRIARLNFNGSLDTSFIVGDGAQSTFAVSDVKKILILSDNKILIGGDFVQFDNNNRIGIARLNENGSLDYSFNPLIGFSNGGSKVDIFAFAEQQDSKILVGGSFTRYDNVNRNHILRLNGESLSNTEFDIAKKLLLFPNPAKSIINLSNYIEIGYDKIKIIDITGKVILEQACNTSQINIENLKDGFYILQAYKNNYVFENKFIKQ